jgi:NADH:ubiquinone oxidoreductase subunit F (NADH-binding)/(2Fe-2S) ferredoxin
MPRISSTAELEELRKRILSQRDLNKSCIAVCGGTGCHNQGNKNIVGAFNNELGKKKLKSKTDIRETGCHGFCEQGPVVVIFPEQICYTKVTPEDVPEIISETIVGKKVIERLLYTDPNTGEKAVHENDIPFYKNQMRLVINDHNKISPTSIEDYLAIGGYSALTKVLQDMSPEQVIAEVKKSNIRGRSGNGFAVGRKWEACQKAEADTKYLICNCHEGDPGAFVDRRIMEGNPHNIIEGMIIGAYAIKATDGFIFVGDEFPLTVHNTGEAIKQAEEYGLLGKNILGSGLNFTIKIIIDGGNYVCGESTALTASMEGRVGEPITKYDHATERGLWAKPTDLNNLQSWANIPLIINMGADSYIKIGKERSQGTRVFSLSGAIKNSGIVEAPMGMPFKKIVYDIGGGIRENNKFKAIEVGGPMGGFIPESQLDITVDFDELTKAGLTLGPGLTVIDENTCIVDTVKFFLTFLANESCGKCTPCREGLRQMLQILDRITDGRGQKGDLELLKAISEVQKAAALCALGQGASNTLTSSLKVFGDEFLAHIEEKRCPAGVCKVLSAASRV